MFIFLHLGLEDGVFTTSSGQNGKHTDFQHLRCYADSPTHRLTHVAITDVTKGTIFLQWTYTKIINGDSQALLGKSHTREKKARTGNNATLNLNHVEIVKQQAPTNNKTLIIPTPC